MDDALPDQVAAAWLAAMRRGDWEQAWRETDRIELPRRTMQAGACLVRQPHHLVWDGTSFAGRSVLIRCEHGLGDTLQFLRFVPLVARIAREVNLLVQPQLLSLLRGAPGLGTVRNAWTRQPAPPHEVQIEVMELAYALRTRIDTVPPPYPHLRPQVAARTAMDLPQDGRLRVGLVWAASDWDRERSLPLAALEPLLQLEPVRFYSLQQGLAARQRPPAHWPVTDLSPYTADIADAAAAMLALDLIITVDGMPAHLSATLGRPTWLLLKHRADWRWMNDSADSPWYPAMRLFRQPAPGDWDTVVMQAAQALRQAG